MDHWSEDLVQSLNKEIKATVQNIYVAVERKDIQRLSELVRDDLFVLGAAADAVSIGKDQFLTELGIQFERARDVEIAVQSSELQIGFCGSDRSAWFLDRLAMEIAGENAVSRTIPIRFTGLLVRDQDWRLAAAYWSIPLRSNEYQYALLQEGKIQPGVALEDSVAPEAQPLAASLVQVMAQPTTMPELYSTRQDAFTIGSTVDEVFMGADGKAFVEQIAGLPLKFAIRGGIRGRVSADGCTAWMATHMDIVGGLTMPYRFFYIWYREENEWKIVVSHNAVSIDPSNPGFDIP